MSLVFNHVTNDISTNSGAAPTIGGAAAGGGTLQVDTTCAIQPADEGLVTGNARGLRAVEMQMCRSAATQSAIGPNSFIGGGACNSIFAAGGCTVVAGGQGNTATKQHSVISGGYKNTVSDCMSIVGGGFCNVISAGGHRAVIVGGQCNKILGGGHCSFIGGGMSNRACGTLSVIGGGFNNYTCSTSSHGSVLGGKSNSVRRSCAGIVAGYKNIANGAGSFIGAGWRSTTTGVCSVIAGGCYNITGTSAGTSWVPGGARGCAVSCGQGAHASGMFAVAGDAQHSDFIARKQTTDDTCQELFLDGSAARIGLDKNEQLFSFNARVVGKHTTFDSEVLSKVFSGVIERNSAGATAFVSSVGTNTVVDTTSGIWEANVFADAANNALGICVSGTAATVNWVSHIDTVEIKT